jgi:hypothetical protein
MLDQPHGCNESNFTNILLEAFSPLPSSKKLAYSNTKYKKDASVTIVQKAALKMLVKVTPKAVFLFRLRTSLFQAKNDA